MTTTMKSGTAPSILSPSKQKVNSDLMNLSSAKQSHRVSFDVGIERRSTDGVAKVYARINDYGLCYPSSMSTTSPLKEEYTDIAKFAKDVHDLIITAAAAV